MLHHIISYTVILSICILVSGGCRDSGSYKTRTRIVCIAAVEMEWDYAPDSNEFRMDKSNLYEEIAQNMLMKSSKNLGKIYQKVMYREHVYDTSTETCRWEASYRINSTYSGIMGPTIRAVVGDTVVVHFNNQASNDYSLVPDGLTFSGNMQQLVGPGESFTYVWHATSNSGPLRGQGSTTSWLYRSDNSEDDVHTGLVGAIIVTDSSYVTSKKNRQHALPCDADNVVVLMTCSFDESRSAMLERNLLSHIGGDGDIYIDLSKYQSDEQFVASNTRNSINGYMYGNLGSSRGFSATTNERYRVHVLDCGAESSDNIWAGGQSLKWSSISTASFMNELRHEEKIRAVKNIETSGDVGARLMTSYVQFQDRQEGEWLVQSSDSDLTQAGMIAIFELLPASEVGYSSHDEGDASAWAEFSFVDVCLGVGVLALIIWVGFYIYKEQKAMTTWQQLPDNSSHTFCSSDSDVMDSTQTELEQPIETTDEESCPPRPPSPVPSRSTHNVTPPAPTSRQSLHTHESPGRRSSSRLSRSMRDTEYSSASARRKRAMKRRELSVLQNMDVL